MSIRTGLAVAAIVPAAAIPLAALLTPRTGHPVTTTSRHRLAHLGHTGEWGAGSPSRHHHRLSLDDLAQLLRLIRGGFGLLLVAWIPAYGTDWAWRRLLTPIR
jgi:hypothetical protein